MRLSCPLVLLTAMLTGDRYPAVVMQRRFRWSAAAPGYASLLVKPSGIPEHLARRRLRKHFPISGSPASISAFPSTAAPARSISCLATARWLADCPITRRTAYRRSRRTMHSATRRPRRHPTVRLASIFSLPLQRRTSSRIRRWRPRSSRDRSTCRPAACFSTTCSTGSFGPTIAWYRHAVDIAQS